MADDAQDGEQHRAHDDELKGTGYELFIGALSVLSVINLVLQYVIADAALDTVLSAMNGLLSAIFLGDFLYRILTAPSKRRYFFREYGWADLLASMPVPQVKVFRAFRVVRVVRLLRADGVAGVGGRLLGNRAASALYSLLLMGILVLQFGSLWMLRIEQNAPGANITTASSALWYVIVTISTVGYGDQYPVTNGGRLLGSMIIIVGVGIFGTFTGYLANLFLAPRRAKGAKALSHGDAEARRQERLRELVAQQQATAAEIEELLRGGKV